MVAPRKAVGIDMRVTINMQQRGQGKPLWRRRQLKQALLYLNQTMVTAYRCQSCDFTHMSIFCIITGIFLFVVIRSHSKIKDHIVQFSCVYSTWILIHLSNANIVESKLSCNFFVVLGIKARASYILGKSSTRELHLRPVCYFARRQ